MSGDVVVSAASPAREIPKWLLTTYYLLLTTYYLLLTTYYLLLTTPWLQLRFSMPTYLVIVVIIKCSTAIRMIKQYGKVTG